MTMVYNRSELSMSRTGTQGGLRRGAAAAAIGAVLVLTTGVPASQATEGSPDPGEPAVPAVDTQSLPVVVQLKGKPARAREDAPGQNRDGKNAKGKAPSGNGQGGADTRPTPAPSPTASPSASAVPSALRPAIRATEKPAPTPEPTATATASPVPTSSAPASNGPSYSAPADSAPAASRTAAPAPAGSAPASSGTAPAPVPAGSVPESPRTPGAPAAETSAAGGPAPAQPASPDSSVAGNLAVTGKGQSAADAAAEDVSAPVAAATGGQAGYVPIYSVPQAQAGWTPYAAAMPGSPVRSSASLSAQPEPKRALVWLGSGLVGVAGAAGLVFFRLRNP
ncbi:hypothetical protein ACFVYC_01520 [Pseudarthrobacter sp. NPDC058329]|uniref:hypothetical protein n=1 Tax=Pseudarthrobacter sp. NPDC058329 TaxID=3346448 RepID=UPI0036DE0DFB